MTLWYFNGFCFLNCDYIGLSVVSSFVNIPLMLICSMAMFLWLLQCCCVGVFLMCCLGEVMELCVLFGWVLVVCVVIGLV